MRRRFLTLGLLPALMLLAAACGEDAPTPTSVPPTPSPTPHMVETPAPETTEVSAPIENVAVNIAESDPPQYFLEITSGLPDACHTFDRVETERSGTEITVTVINRVAPGEMGCAEIYKTERHSVALGSDFEPGVTYTVRVNGETLTFTPEGGAADSGASGAGDDRGQGEGDEDSGGDSTTVEVAAPIESVAVNIAESDPPQYFLEVTSGLPDACHTFDRVETERSGTEITVAVINRVVTGDVMCAQVYGTETNSVALGTDFDTGATYTVRVNDETLTFTAE